MYVSRAYYTDMHPIQRKIFILGSFLKNIGWFDLETNLFVFTFNGYNPNTDSFVTIEFFFERTIEGKISTHTKICVFVSFEEVKYIFDLDNVLRNPENLMNVLFFYSKNYNFT